MFQQDPMWDQIFVDGDNDGGGGGDAPPLSPGRGFVAPF